MVWYVVNKQEYLGCGKELGKVYRDIMGKHYPVRHCQVIWHIENKAN
jgi:hypothetical protein